MNRMFLLIAVFLLSVNLFAQETNTNTSETTLIFVRHAEKMDDGSTDPSLNSEGKERALRLANLLLDEFDISVIYSTFYKRTLQTAKPLSDSLGLAITEYDLSDPRAFVAQLKEQNRGKTALIVGHSNTTPLLINIALGAKKYELLEEDAYGNIFILTVEGDGNTHVEERQY